MCSCSPARIDAAGLRGGPEVVQVLEVHCGLCEVRASQQSTLREVCERVDCGIPPPADSHLGTPARPRPVDRLRDADRARDRARRRQHHLHLDPGRPAAAPAARPRAPPRPRLRDADAPRAAVLAELGDGADRRSVQRRRPGLQRPRPRAAVRRRCSCSTRPRTRSSSRSRRATSASADQAPGAARRPSAGGGQLLGHRSARSR